MSTQGLLADAAKRLGGAWWFLLIAGIIWIIIGFVVLRFDRSTVYVVSIVFGVMLLLAAFGEIFRAFIIGGGWRIWHVIFAALLVAAAVIAFVNPGATFESLAIVAGFYFVFIGIYDVATSLFTSALIPTWWLQLLGVMRRLEAPRSGLSVRTWLG